MYIFKIEEKNVIYLVEYIKGKTSEKNCKQKAKNNNITEISLNKSNNINGSNSIKRQRIPG